MASQTISAFSFSTHVWPDPANVFQIRSYCQPSNYRRNHANFRRVGTDPTFHTTPEGHTKAGAIKKKKPPSVWLGKPRVSLVWNLSRLGSRVLKSPASYFTKKAKAFYDRIFGGRGSNVGSAGYRKEVMCVEPYFSIPVVPVTTSAPFI